MKKITIKNTDLSVSNICLGTGGFGTVRSREEAFEILDAFTAGGGNFIDTANVYGRYGANGGNLSERVLGAWLAARNTRDGVIIATKGGHYDFAAPQTPRVTRDAVQTDLDESLRTLGLEQIPLYWLHRDNPALPIEVIVDLLEGFVKSGKIRYYGVSNYAPDRLAAARDYAQKSGYGGFAAVSNQWSLASAGAGGGSNPDPSLTAVSAREYRWHVETGVPLIPYESTAKGFFEKLRKAKPKIKNGELLPPADALNLPDALKRAYLNRRNLRIYEELEILTKQTGYSAQVLALADLLHPPFQVIPVTAVSRAAQLDDIFTASETEFPGGILEQYTFYGQVK
ncbi:MAG: aldo/keto reductase [Clostridiales bacterium]|jgi:aryl-alcohol dehydrogenase-like predicted oxidoreductase|nr:aldo/keto reductase [Clostridiales bacterium]